MQKLQDYTELTQLCKTDQSQLFRAVGVLISLYAKGVDHLDVSPSNVFYQNRSGRPVIIDWQYCRFHAPRSDFQLVVQAAHFLYFAALDPRVPLWTDWIGELHRQSGTRMPLGDLRDAIHNRQKNRLRVGDRLEAPERLFKAA